MKVFAMISSIAILVQVVCLFPRMPKRKRGKPTTARLDAFARGFVWGLHVAGVAREEICKKVMKKDGTPVGLKAVDKVIAHKKQHPSWKGTDSIAGGRPAAISDAQRKKLIDLVFQERGRATVTVKYCKKKLVFLRPLNKSTVCRYLHEAGLAWLTRRLKTAVPKEHKLARIEYCKWILSRQQRTLTRFAYTDGTSFYLARGPAEFDSKQRATLGKFVWRMSTGKDGLHGDNVGGSLYAKAQGKPVKIWGFFCYGRLEYYVLPEDVDEKGKKKTTNMNRWTYNWLIESKFETWRRNCIGDDRPVHLVQDHERCLWYEDNLEALAAAGCPVLQNYPKSSPDLNAIEGWWHRLKQRLEETSPETLEKRTEFLVRLRRTVTWMNDNWSEDALRLATNQKERAQEVLSPEVMGSKCSF